MILSKITLPSSPRGGYTGTMGNRTEILGDDRAFLEWMADLSKLEHKQLPFALSLALNDSMFAARKKIVSQYPSLFDGGLNYMRRTLKVDKSNKNQPVIEATVGEATGYMGMQQWGHTKSAYSGGQMAIPTREALKRYATKSGKIKKKGWPSRLTKGYKGPVAAGKRGGRGRRGGKGQEAIFPLVTTNGRRFIVARSRTAERTGSEWYAPGDLVFLYHYQDLAVVKKRWEFDALVVGEVHRTFKKNYLRRIRYSVKTAK